MSFTGVGVQLDRSGSIFAIYFVSPNFDVFFEGGVSLAKPWLALTELVGVGEVRPKYYSGITQYGEEHQYFHGNGQSSILLNSGFLSELRLEPAVWP